MTQPSATQKPTRTRRFLDENQLIEDAFRLGVQVFESGFRPNFIVGLWRGGSAVGIYVQECLQTLGVKTDHIALRTSYRGMEHYDTMIASPVEAQHAQRYAYCHPLSAAGRRPDRSQARLLPAYHRRLARIPL